MILSTIVLAVIALLSPSGRQRAQHFKPLNWPMSDGISVMWLVDDRGSLRVGYFGPSVKDGNVPPPPPVSGVQVWVLKKNGTVLRQLSGLRVSGAIFNAGLGSIGVETTFEHAEASDLAGIVVMVREKLLVRETPSN
ncbi:MAG: hypothetical protein ABIW19_13910 [Vicinamibacterales bacterium]